MGRVCRQGQEFPNAGCLRYFKADCYRRWNIEFNDSHFRDKKPAPQRGSDSHISSDLMSRIIALLCRCRFYKVFDEIEDEKLCPFCLEAERDRERRELPLEFVENEGDAPTVPDAPSVVKIEVFYTISSMGGI